MGRAALRQIERPTEEATGRRRGERKVVLYLQLGDKNRLCLVKKEVSMQKIKVECCRGVGGGANEASNKR